MPASNLIHIVNANSVPATYEVASFAPDLDAIHSAWLILVSLSFLNLLDEDVYGS